MNKILLATLLSCLSTQVLAAPNKSAPRRIAPAVTKAAVMKRWGSFFDATMGQMDIPHRMNVSARQLPGVAKKTFFRVMKQTDGIIMGAYHDKRTKTYAVADYTDGESDARFRFFDAKGKLVARAWQTDDGTLSW